MADSQSELLAELQGYGGWTQQDTELAKLAVRGACLRSSYDIASTKFWAAAESSSNSSMTVKMFGPAGSATSTEAFLEVLRNEIRSALAHIVADALRKA
jgi:hypothetical protein